MCELVKGRSTDACISDSWRRGLFLGRRPTASRARKVQPTNFQWEGVAGQDGVHGRKRVPVIPTAEGMNEVVLAGQVDHLRCHQRRPKRGSTFAQRAAHL
jgi:hypothetical protein